MWILFEDADGTTLSNLIKVSYKGTGIDVGFVGGAGNFVNYIDEKGIYNETVSIYFDLVPDNPETAKGFRTLRKRLRKADNITVYPVVCTEYNVLRSLGIDVPALDDVVLNVNYPEGIISAEKYYKYLLGTLEKPCQRVGKFAGNSLEVGRYYTCDCPCKDDSSCEVNLTLFDKSVKANRCFNVVPKIDVFAPFSNKTPGEAVDEFISRHNRIVRILGDRNNWNPGEFGKRLV